MRAEKLWLLGLLASVGGCPDRTIAAVSVDQTKVEEKDFPATLRRDVDILFLIDDSGSMKEEQDSLKANFHRFISVLEIDRRRAAERAHRRDQLRSRHQRDRRLARPGDRLVLRRRQGGRATRGARRRTEVPESTSTTATAAARATTPAR